MKRALRHPAFWAWLVLAAVPADLLAWAKGWDMVDPAYLALGLLWWPVDSLGRLGALRLLVQAREPGTAAGSLARRLPSALAAEVLLGLRSTVLLLAGLVPALAVASLAGLESRWAQLSVAALAVGGVLPCVWYNLLRWQAPLHVLDGANASEALDLSAAQVGARAGDFLRRLWPWLALGWALDAAAWLLPDPWGLALAPFSAAAGLLGLLKAARPD